MSTLLSELVSVNLDFELILYHGLTSQIILTTRLGRPYPWASSVARRRRRPIEVYINHGHEMRCAQVLDTKHQPSSVSLQHGAFHSGPPLNDKTLPKLLKFGVGESAYKYQPFSRTKFRRIH